MTLRERIAAELKRCLERHPELDSDPTLASMEFHVYLHQRSARPVEVTMYRKNVETPR